MHLSIEPVTRWPRTLLAAVITLAVIVTAETLAHKLSSREPRLAYVPSESLPFNGGGKNVGIYQIDVTNEGDAAADALTGSMRILGATIDNERVSAPGALPVDAKAEGDTVYLSAPSLNPTETIHVSILASSTTPLPIEPDVSVRATGVSAFRRVRGTSAPPRFSLLPVLATATTSLALMLALQFAFRRRANVDYVASRGGWRKVANVFWLGHDLHWARTAANSWGNRERILHGLRQSKHHASEIGLAGTKACQDLENLNSSVTKMADGDLTIQSRPGIAARVDGLLQAFSDLAKAQQPEFKAGPG
jgi:hypothetical protein